MPTQQDSLMTFCCLCNYDLFSEFILLPDCTILGGHELYCFVWGDFELH